MRVVAEAMLLLADDEMRFLSSGELEEVVTHVLTKRQRKETQKSLFCHFSTTSLPALLFLSWKRWKSFLAPLVTLLTPPPKMKK